MQDAGGRVDSWWWCTQQHRQETRIRRVSPGADQAGTELKPSSAATALGAEERPITPSLHPMCRLTLASAVERQCRQGLHAVSSAAAALTLMVPPLGCPCSLIIRRSSAWKMRARRSAGRAPHPSCSSPRQPADCGVPGCNCWSSDAPACCSADGQGGRVVCGRAEERLAGGGGGGPIADGATLSFRFNRAYRASPSPCSAPG